MWQKISDLSLMVYLAVTGFVQDLKRDDRGLSGVVVTVLLVLVAILAVVTIWGFLDGWLTEVWNDIVRTQELPGGNSLE